MKYNIQIYTQSPSLRTNFYFQLLLNIVNYEMLYLLIRWYRLSFTLLIGQTSTAIGLNSKALNSVWVRRVVVYKRLTVSGAVTQKLLLHTNTLNSLHMSQLVTTSSNFSSLFCLKSLTVCDTDINLKTLAYLSNLYYSNILNFNQSSLLLTYYLVNNTNVQFVMNKPTNSVKSLFIINIKKL